MSEEKTEQKFVKFGTILWNKERQYSEKYIPCYNCDGGEDGIGCKICGGTGGRWIKFEIMG